jgi:hypothetical protein
MAEYIPIFQDWITSTELLSADEKGRLIDALVLYAFGGDYAAQIQGNEKFLFGVMSAQIDRHFEYLAKQKERGQLGGRPRKNPGFSEKTLAFEKNPGFSEKANNNNNNNNNENNNNNDNKNDNKNNNDNENTDTRGKPRTPAPRFSPPTVEEVRAYCTERGNQIDAQHFVDFYASKGWRVGNQPMKDWKACVRTWEQRDRGGGFSGTGKGAKPNPALQYSQREYTDEDDDDFMRRINSDLLRDAGQQ